MKRSIGGNNSPDLRENKTADRNASITNIFPFWVKNLRIIPTKKHKLLNLNNHSQNKISIFQSLVLEKRHLLFHQMLDLKFEQYSKKFENK